MPRVADAGHLYFTTYMWAQDMSGRLCISLAVTRSLSLASLVLNVQSGKKVEIRSTNMNAFATFWVHRFEL